MQKTLLTLLGAAFLWLLAPPAPAQAPASLTSEELVERASAALAELKSLRARTNADREAVEVMTSDLEGILERLEQPPPPRPSPLGQLELPDDDALAQTIETAERFRDEWLAREALRERGEQSLRSADELGKSLRADNVAFLDRLVALRPLLIETQRRLVAGEVLPEQLGDPRAGEVVPEWIEQTAQLLDRREELMAQIEAALAKLDAQRKAFEAYPPTDPQILRDVHRIALALQNIAESIAVQGELRGQLESAPADTLPTEFERLAKEWDLRRQALEQIAAEADELGEQLAALEAERAAERVPRRGDVPDGDELEEVRQARAEVELSKLLIAYYERDHELALAIRAKQNEVLEADGKASSSHGSFSRQTARLLLIIRHIGTRQAAGELTDFDIPQEHSPAVVWDAWRNQQLGDSVRDERAAVLEEALATEELPSAQRVEAEREKLRQLEAQLQIELSYAEFVSNMTGRSDDELLALLRTDSEIDERVGEIREELARTRTEVADKRAACLATSNRIESLEHPFTRTVLANREDQIGRIPEELRRLPDNEFPADRSAKLVPTEADYPRPYRSKVHGDEAVLTAFELAQGEEERILNEQQFARILLEYFVTTERIRDELGERLEEAKQADARQEELLTARIEQAKIRYAAARELQLRIVLGRTPRDREPAGIEAVLGRKELVQTSDELRTFRRESTTFQKQAEYELYRLGRITEFLQWARLRSEATDQRAHLIGRPVAHLSSGLTEIDDLNVVERKNLEYEAQAESANDRSLPGRMFGQFTSASEQERFEEPLSAYYLELCNSRRVMREFKAAIQGYEGLAQVCREEREAMEPVRGLAGKAIEFRLEDYHAARAAAGVARHPTSRSRLEEKFRNEYASELPYRLSFNEGDVDDAARVLFGAEVRLISQRAIQGEIDRFLSKVGVEQEIGWYQDQVARIRSRLETEEGRAADLEQRITALRSSFEQRLRSNAIKGVAITLLIPFIAFLLVRGIRRFTRRFEHDVVGELGEDEADRRRRLRTISATGTAAISVLIWSVAIVYVFARLGLNITPLVASASVAGLALAFGAQALIKDFFYGFFILLENQFTVGDVVQLGTITGTVERISLRITVLRDLKGVVHYIPNGSIGQVSNMTQGWSRVVMEISVGYGEDPDRASEVLGEVLLTMAAEEPWQGWILEEPVVAGVENLTERSVDIRVMIKTRPGRQWGVAREARRRIKRRFDELGIQVPFPTRVIHHVYEGATKPEPETGEEAPNYAG